MVENIIAIMYALFFISMMCAINVSIKLYTNGNNYLLAVLAAEMALTDLIVLSSTIWITDFKAIPRAFCIFQGIILQYSAYLQIVTALCFSFQIYQLLGHRKQGTNERFQKIYISSIVGIPIIMTVIVAIVSVQTDAIRPFVLNCDIKSPTWVRLIGYPGFNFALSFFGVYLSAYAAYKVFLHLDRFKPFSSRDNSNSPDMVDELTTPTPMPRQRTPSNSNPVLQNQIPSYNMTRAAAIRMVLFSCGFALLNVFSAIQTAIYFMKGGTDEKGLRGNDFAGAFMGLVIFLVFGLRNYGK